MDSQVEFYGPGDIYCRKTGGEWEAWAEPFSIAGTGSTFEAAVKDAQRNVMELFEMLAEEIASGNGKIEILVPLSEDMKDGARVAIFEVYCVRAVGRTKRRRAPRVPETRPLSRRNVIQLLRQDGPIGVTPALAVG